jgi:hypothetical protein
MVIVQVDHLEFKHHINRQNGVYIAPNERTPAATSHNGFSTLLLGSLFYQSTFEKWKTLFIRWIVYCHIAFFQIENKYFREMLISLFPKLNDLLPKARSTIRGWILDEYKRQRSFIMHDLSTSLSAIHLSFDLWTSPSQVPILAVVAHYISANGVKQCKLIALREIFGQHTGANIAAVMVAIIKDFNLKTNLGSIVGDNAEANDVTVDKIFKSLFPNLSLRKRKERRMRCFGHIVNLAAQAFIIGSDAEKVNREIDRAIQEMDFKKVRKLWKKQGAVSLFQNLIRYVRASPQRRQFFRLLKGNDMERRFDGLQVSIFDYSKKATRKVLNNIYSFFNQIKLVGIRFLQP